MKSPCKSAQSRSRRGGDLKYGGRATNYQFWFFFFLDMGKPPLASSRIHYLTVTDSSATNFNIEFHCFPAQKTSMLKHGFYTRKIYNAKYYIIDLMPYPIIVSWYVNLAWIIPLLIKYIYWDSACMYSVNCLKV